MRVFFTLCTFLSLLLLLLLLLLLHLIAGQRARERAF